MINVKQKKNTSGETKNYLIPIINNPPTEPADKISIDKEDYCAICKDNHEFIFPLEIMDAATNGNLVIFAGAGISTESKKVFIETLYSELKYDLNVPKEKEIEFPDLVSQFCNQINGRKLFLKKVKKRFDYVHQYSENYRMATDFHRELATIWTINTIITTNWDDYFERECSAIPIVTPDDFAFFDINERKVFKIHGSINNYGSIIASRDDYEKCYKALSKGVIGSFLKTILATKVVLFIGYSFRDFDFVKIYEYLKKELRDVIPHSYIISLDPKVPENLKKLKTTLIKTDGTHFIRVLKKHLLDQQIMLPDSKYDFIELVQNLLNEIHLSLFEKFEAKKFPHLLFCASYQDGLNHAFDYLLNKRKLGTPSNPCHIHHSILAYENARKERVRKKSYIDVSYIDGYINGLTLFLLEGDDIHKEPEFLPFYYIYGYGEIMEPEEFYKKLKKNDLYHKSSYTWIKRYLRHHYGKNLEILDKIAFHHTPFL